MIASIDESELSERILTHRRKEVGEEAMTVSLGARAAADIAAVIRLIADGFAILLTPTAVMLRALLPAQERDALELLQNAVVRPAQRRRPPREA